MALLQKNHCKSPVFLLFFFAVTTVAAGASLAQEPSEPLTLFEAIDSDEQNSRRDAPVPRRAEGAGAEFSLVGVTRIGRQRTVLLQHSSGETLSVAIKGDITPIPKHDGFTVALADSGEIAVQFPASRICTPSEDQGVRCDAGNRALLSIAAAEPLPVPEPAIEPEAPPGGDTWLATEEESGQPPQNPFEALRRRAARGERGDVVMDPEEQARRFRPRRIDPSRVPEGKRVVSTPFGDRLVDI